MEPKALALKIAAILDGKKALDIRGIKIDDISTLADYFILATGTSNTQVRALADEVEFKLKEAGVAPYHIEGYDARNWVLMDYGSVVVHIFYPEARKFYNLEGMWADGTEMELGLTPD